jgi:hypothetical protein
VCKDTKKKRNNAVVLENRLAEIIKISKESSIFVRYGGLFGDNLI